MARHRSDRCASVSVPTAVIAVTADNCRHVLSGGLLHLKGKDIGMPVDFLLATGDTDTILSSVMRLHGVEETAPELQEIRVVAGITPS